MNAPHRHIPEDELLLALYSAEQPAGLDSCPDCAARWQRLSARRAALVVDAAAAPCSDERLRAQRQAVWRKIERPAHVRILRALPAAATMCVLLIAVALNGPAPQPEPKQMAAAVSDEQLFNDIAKVVNDSEPRAVEPMRGLFNESTSMEVQ
ncbi:MAG: hypothetical protein HY821_12185 [Acidobacteria bacterium]|nr:hypothetical protein [Acidobacteriota bacterium]